jgi:preprotein translocase subunit YajC
VKSLVFNALDHLNGWQLLLVLSPIVVIMMFIKHREERANSIDFKIMNSLQQGWVFLNLLAPGLSAKILSMLDDEERTRVIEAGGSLQGSATRVALPVLDVYFRKGDGEKGAPSKDIQEVCRHLNLKYENEPRKLLASYRKAFL